MTLDDIAEINPKTDVSRLSEDAFVSFIPMSDLSDDGRWLGDDCRELRSIRNGYTAFADGDVLFAKITPCMENGKGALVSGLRNGVGFGSTEYHVLRARTKEDAEYLYQWTKFQVLRSKAANAMTGSAGQQRVPADFLVRYTIANHTPAERAKIGSVLERLDRSIEQTEALLAKQQRIKTGLIHDLLTRGLDSQGCLRDRSTHQFKTTDIGDVPVDWRVVPIESLVPPTSPICYGIVQVGTDTHGGVPTIAIRDLDDILIANLHRTDPARESRFARSRSQGGDILISIKATTGRIGVAPQGFDGNISRDLARVRLHSSECPHFFKYHLQSAAGQSRLDSITVGTTRKELSIIPLRQVLVSRPNPDEQHAIAGRIQKSETELSKLEGTIIKLRRLRSGLMHDLLTGEIPVTPLLPTSAS